MSRKSENRAVVVGDAVYDVLGEKLDKSKLAICKAHSDCFSCVGGYCTALTPKHVGGECAFYKNREQCKRENIKTYDRLVEQGRYDLLEKYSESIEAFGMMDSAMEAADNMEQEMRLFQEKNLREEMSRVAGNSGES